MLMMVVVIRNIFVVLFYFCGVAFLQSCSSVHRGYKFEDGDTLTMRQMVLQKSTIQQIMNKFGSPSFINAPINDTICYVEANGKKIAFNRFYAPTYQFACITFENDVAKDLQIKSISSIKKQKMVKYDTSFNKPL